MADNSDTPNPPTKAAPARKTMAPAARRPAGDDERASTAASLKRLDDREFDELEQAVREERSRRGRQGLSEPSFGLSEGERQELEMTGKTTSPWTGRVIEGDGQSTERPAPADGDGANSSDT